MSYVTFIAIVLTILTAYHYIKYKKSNYGRFEHYLDHETNEVISYLITIWTILLSMCFVIGVIYLGGELISWI